LGRLGCAFCTIEDARGDKKKEGRGKDVSIVWDWKKVPKQDTGERGKRKKGLGRRVGQVDRKSTPGVCAMCESRGNQHGGKSVETQVKKGEGTGNYSGRQKSRNGGAGREGRRGFSRGNKLVRRNSETQKPKRRGFHSFGKRGASILRVCGKNSKEEKREGEFWEKERRIEWWSEESNN